MDPESLLATLLLLSVTLLFVGVVTSAQQPARYPVLGDTQAEREAEYLRRNEWLRGAPRSAFYLDDSQP